MSKINQQALKDWLDANPEATVRDFMEQFGVTRGGVKYWEQKLSFRLKRSNNKATEGLISFIREHLEDMSYAAMSSSLGLSRSTIGILKHKNINRPKKYVKMCYSPKRCQIAAALVKHLDRTYQAVGEEFGVTRQYVQQIAKEIGIERRAKNVDHSM